MSTTFRKPRKQTPAPTPQPTPALAAQAVPPAPSPAAPTSSQPAPSSSDAPAGLRSDRIALLVWLTGATIILWLMLKDLLAAIVPW